MSEEVSESSVRKEVKNDIVMKTPDRKRSRRLQRWMIFSALGFVSLLLSISYFVTWITYPKPSSWMLVLNPYEMVFYHGIWVDYPRLMFYIGILPDAGIYLAISVFFFLLSLMSFPIRGRSIFARIGANNLVHSHITRIICAFCCAVGVFLLDNLFISWISLISTSVPASGLLLFHSLLDVTPSYQHEISIFLLSVIALSSLVAFRSSLLTAQIIAGSLILLPILVYFFDHGDFAINFATDLGPFAWVSNEILFIFLGTILLATFVLRPVLSRVL